MKEKKTLILLIMIAVVGIVGLTIAYFTNTTSISNLFSTNPYGTTVTEVFESPDNWLPGTTTPKTIEVTNSGSVDEAVRISYTETWKSKKGNTLSGLIDSNGNLTDEEENSEHAAIINFSDNGDFTYSNGYYYYNYKLAPNEKTSTLIDSVTFNSKVKNSSNCTTTELNGKKTITCNSTQDGYDGATYILTFTIETVQYDKYMSAWGTNVVVSEAKPVATFCSYEIGEDIVYDGSNYYVLQDLNDYVLALKEDPLTSEEINIYSSDYVSEDGEYPYYKSDTCNISIKPWGEEIFDNDIGCTTDYNQSNIKELIDNWSNEYSNDLKEVDGYKARLITKDEVISYFHYESFDTTSVIVYKMSGNTPEWATVRNKPYWSMTEYEDSNSSVYVVYSQIWQTDIPKSKYVRPVINLKKSAIESECNMNNSNKIYYSIGEKISYNNSNYCVINSSKLSEDYVTLIKSDPLTYDELIEYNNGYEIGRDNEDNNVGIISYYKNDDCYYNSDYDKNITGCSSNYDTSNIKNVIDNWSNSFNNDLKEVDGYKVRLIKYGELKDIGYESVMHGTAFYLESSNSTKCVGFKTWYDGGNIVPTVSGTHGISELNPVRPVINLKKCALTNTCE